jgi:hypothetical protein
MNVPFRDGQGGVASTLALQSHQETCCAWLARSKWRWIYHSTLDPKTENVTYVSSNNDSLDEHRSQKSVYAILEIHK